MSAKIEACPEATPVARPLASMVAMPALSVPQVACTVRVLPSEYVPETLNVSAPLILMRFVAGVIDRLASVDGGGDGLTGLSLPHPTATARAKTMTMWVFMTPLFRASSAWSIRRKRPGLHHPQMRNAAALRLTVPRSSMAF